MTREPPGSDQGVTREITREFYVILVIVFRAAAVRGDHQGEITRERSPGRDHQGEIRKKITYRIIRAARWCGRIDQGGEIFTH